MCFVKIDNPGILQSDVDKFSIGLGKISLTREIRSGIYMWPIINKTIRIEQETGHHGK